MSKIESFLKFIEFKEVNFWDVKRYVVVDISSKYPLVKLSELMKQ